MKNIENAIESFFKSLRHPSYAGVLDRYNAGFPKLLFEKLNDRYWIKDGTDIDTPWIL